jgi:parallel beta-helix repeat protein
VTYVEGGTYELSRNLNLTSADNGVSFLAAPGQKPILSGAAHGLINLITLSGTQHVTLQGLTFQNTVPGKFNGAVSLFNATSNVIVGNLFINNDRGVLLTGSSNNIVSGNEINSSVLAGVNAGASSNNNIIDSNLISGTSLQGTGTGSAGVWLTGGNGNQITHNRIENTAGSAIALANWTTAVSNLNVGNTIAYNSIVNANDSPLANDSGGIYVDGRAGVDTKTTIDNNSVNLAVSSTTGADVGIYLDDFTSGVTVTRNIVTGGNLGFHIHGGRNNMISNNIFDMAGRSARNVGAALFQSEPGGPVPVMAGNVVTKNIIYSTAISAPSVWVSYGGMASISGNLYWNTHNLAMTGTYGDALADKNFQYGDPQFANSGGANYSLGPGSAAAAIGFTPIDQSGIGLAPATAHWYPDKQ